jgi:hypothetical protein
MFPVCVSSYPTTPRNRNIECLVYYTFSRLYTLLFEPKGQRQELFFPESQLQCNRAASLCLETGRMAG